MGIFDHDYDAFPELTNAQLDLLRFTSPHIQIEEDFHATVVRVADGDTITLRTDFRDFDFPLRFLDINAPELNEEGGKESGDWLRGHIFGQDVMIVINKQNRVGKFGRLLGKVVSLGMDMGNLSIQLGYSKPFDSRNEGKIPDISKMIAESGL